MALSPTWRDLFRIMDTDGDGVVSERDFAQAMLPYDPAVVAVEALSDLCYDLASIGVGGRAPASGSPAPSMQSPDFGALFRRLDRNAIGAVSGRDLLRFLSSSSAAAAASHIDIEQVRQWWRLAVGPEDSSVALSFNDFEAAFAPTLPFRLAFALIASLILRASSARFALRSSSSNRARSASSSSWMRASSFADGPQQPMLSAAQR